MGEDDVEQLNKERLGMDIRKKFFSHRLVDPWNRLSETMRPAKPIKPNLTQST